MKSGGPGATPGPTVTVWMGEDKERKRYSIYLYFLLYVYPKAPIGFRVFYMVGISALPSSVD